MAKVDIVVPCYNYGRFLEPCVRSVLEQSVADLRVLIIDDASSDDSLSVAKRLAQADRRVSVISHSENWGHIRTYNQGIEWAASDYFLLLSADDLLAPGALGRATQLMDENPDIVLTHGKFIEWRDDLPFPELNDQRSFEWRRQDLIREMCAAACCLVNTATAIARTSVQKRVGGYRESLPHAGDLEMWLRFAAHGIIARIDNPTQAICRRHSSNMSNRYFAEKLPDFEQCRKAFDFFFAEYGDLVPESTRLQAETNRALTEHSYISGVAQLCHGRARSGLRLLRYSMQLNARLRYLPPVAMAMEIIVSRIAISLGLRKNEAP